MQSTAKTTLSMLLGFAILISAASTMAATYFWVGSSSGYGDDPGDDPGDNQSWNDPNNWSGGVVPSEVDTVWLGYDDDGKVDDAPQSILISETAYIHDAVVYARGNRQVTLSGSPLIFMVLVFNDALVIHSGAESDTIFESNLGLSRRVHFRNNSGHDVIMVGYVFRPATDPSTAAYDYRYFGSGTNRYRLQGSSAGNHIAHYTGGIITAETENMNFRLSSSTAAGVLELAADANTFTVQPGSPNYTVRRVGTGDRVLHMQRATAGGANSRLDIEHCVDAGPGHFTVRVPDMEPGLRFNTTTNNTIAFYWGSLATRRDIRFHEESTHTAIIGPGDVRLELDSAASVFNVFRPLDNTGGTSLATGILRLRRTDVDGTLHDGQLGPGPLYVSGNATFDLNGIDQTVGRLDGEGAVQLGGGMLSATNGVAPGTNSVGTLTIGGAGGLTLAGVSVFDIVDAATHDQVLFTGDADLTLGGTLDVQVPQTYDNATTRYTIFALNGGTIHGSFDEILTPDGIWAEIDTSSGDVELILSPPGGTTILIR